MGEETQNVKERPQLVKRHTDLEVFNKSFQAAMLIFKVSKSFPKEERYSLTDQIRRSSRSVCSNLSEAWRKRRYEAAFIAKLSDSEAEAAETQTWIQFAVECQYVEKAEAQKLYREYNAIIGMLVNMISQSSRWVLRA